MIKQTCCKPKTSQKRMPKKNNSPGAGGTDNCNLYEFATEAAVGTPMRRLHAHRLDQCHASSCCLCLLCVLGSLQPRGLNEHSAQTRRPASNPSRQKHVQTMRWQPFLITSATSTACVLWQLQKHKINKQCAKACGIHDLCKPCSAPVRANHCVPHAQ